MVDKPENERRKVKLFFKKFPLDLEDTREARNTHEKAKIEVQSLRSKVSWLKRTAEYFSLIRQCQFRRGARGIASANKCNPQ